MERVVHDAEDVGGGRFADVDLIVEVQGIIESALPRMVEREEIVGVGGRFHSAEERMAWMDEGCFTQRDACRWIFGAGDRDPDEVVVADAGACELAAAGADREADSGAALIEFCSGELMDYRCAKVFWQWISPSEAIAGGDHAGEVSVEQGG